MTSVATAAGFPPSWHVKQLKRVAKLRAGDAIAADAIVEQAQYPVFGGNGIRGYTSSYTHSGSYVLIGRQGALCGNIKLAFGRFWASEHAVVARPIDGSDVRWLGALLESMNLNQHTQSAAQPGISVDLVAGLRIPVPPIAAQRAIADYLDRETAQIDALAAAKRRMVELLEERKGPIRESAITAVRRSSPTVRLGHLAFEVDERLGSADPPALLSVSIHHGVLPFAEVIRIGRHARKTW